MLQRLRQWLAGLPRPWAVIVMGGFPALLILAVGLWVFWPGPAHGPTWLGLDGSGSGDEPAAGEQDGSGPDGLDPGDGILDPGAVGNETLPPGITPPTTPPSPPSSPPATPPEAPPASPPESPGTTPPTIPPTLPPTEPPVPPTTPPTTPPALPPSPPPTPPAAPPPAPPTVPPLIPPLPPPPPLPPILPLWLLW